MTRSFFRMVLPSMIAFAFSGVYAIVDGFFIGNNVGDIGLAAINIAYPITAVLTSIGTGIGMGGAICMALAQGRGDTRAAKALCGTCMLTLLLAALAVTFVLFFTFRPLLSLFGATGELYDHAVQYTNVIVLGAAFQILGTGLLPLLRNHNAAVLAMLAMIAGFLTNIVLDYLFIFRFSLGMAGAAAATILGQAVTMIPALIFLLRRRDWISGLLHPQWQSLKRIFHTALSPFGLTLSPNIVLLIMNKFCVLYGGDQAVATYAVVSYVLCVAQLLLQGIGDGAQPLMSQYAGHGETQNLFRVKRMTYLFAQGISLLFLLGALLSAGQIPILFGASADTASRVAQVLPLFLFGILATAFARVTISAYYATGSNGLAALLVYAEPVFLCVSLFTLSPLLGLQGVWLSQPFSQVLLVLLSLLFLLRTRQNHPSPNSGQ